MDEFHVLPAHLALLRHANTHLLQTGEGTAPGLSAKRPFGNGSVYDDIARIVDGRTDGRHDPADEPRYARLYGELGLVLGVLLQAEQFEPGIYIRAQDGWRPVG
ncbi:hypothetical protein [Acrocarpospora catenulata]|uniref:hypothetical protein n=1 Tax=Acrocarpospora catenulata TaxID=2836182 RepID=UPI001BD99C35|nr:hypothetical protein [Acrocarpospora catenulata]